MPRIRYKESRNSRRARTWIDTIADDDAFNDESMGMSARRILVVGSANIDLVTRVPRCPKPGESMFGHAFATITGGKGANQAVAAARLGARTAFAGCVGGDAFGAMQHDCLAADGIDLAGLHAVADVPTGTAVILVGEDGQNSIVVTPGANAAMDVARVRALAPAIAEADVLLLQLEIPLDAVAEALRLARAHGTVSILDAGPAQSVDPALLQGADLVSPNETEAEALTGVVVRDDASALAAAEALRAMGAREVVLKLGARGSLYLGAGDPVQVPPFLIDPVDTTAAGDAFTAALGLRWGEAPVAEVLRFANAVGALSATRHGAQPSLPRLAEVETFLAHATT